MNQKITAYHYSYETGLFAGTSLAFIEYGYDHYIKPQCATFTPLPEFDSATQQCRYLAEHDRWAVEAIPEEPGNDTEATPTMPSELSEASSSVIDEQTHSAQAKPGAMRRLLNRLSSR
ncbi:hypothetical protein [Vibrio spartinae]|uniref:Uncharacterized protein n=1 Tax=Vibrio spartinae TaxID=1918945 RepID=A0ABX6R750_9VIBR|nr:hypothetical protein [Vibrio spartinae]QMV16650.1 hypothetical protein Vspart_04046 [Vibrio spartinae]